MTNKFYLFIFLLAAVSSCIKDNPPPYREADIIDMVIDDKAFLTRGITDNSVQLIITTDADYSHIAPVITLSPGATVYPLSGDTVDFSEGKTVTYRVTAEDRKNYKDYNVSVVPKISLKHGFEEWTTSGIGKAKHPILQDLLWSNANSGIALLVALNMMPAGIFPTDKTTDCVEGEYAALMQTVEGRKVMNNYYPIFAGSLFRGVFSTNMNYPLKSLRLGQAHAKEDGVPSIFNGYYKYSPGSIFTDHEGNNIPGRIDSMSMYAAIFKVAKGTASTEGYLDGETILISDHVVGKAQWTVNDPSLSEAVNGFTRFSIPFVYTEDVDYEAFDYRLTIVCSSSKDGNEYMGAVGSTLIVDEFEIICDVIPE